MRLADLPPEQQNRVLREAAEQLADMGQQANDSAKRAEKWARQNPAHVARCIFLSEYSMVQRVLAVALEEAAEACRNSISD